MFERNTILKNCNSKKTGFVLSVIGIVSIFVLAHFSPVYAINLNTRTITQSVGKGINNGTNKVLDRQLTSLFGFGNFPDTSDPFDTTPFIDPENPASFASPNTGLGAGVPCGPDDPNGPVFPYPCSSELTISNNMSVVINTAQSFNLIMAAPTLGTSGGFFQKFTQTPLGDGTKTVQVEGGFDQTAVMPSATGQVHRYFYSLTTTIDADGKMIGIASGTFLLRTAEEFVPGWFPFGINDSDPRGSGTFTADETGALTCVDSILDPCLNPFSAFP